MWQGSGFVVFCHYFTNKRYTLGDPGGVPRSAQSDQSTFGWRTLVSCELLIFDLRSLGPPMNWVVDCWMGPEMMRCIT